MSLSDWADNHAQQRKNSPPNLRVERTSPLNRPKIGQISHEKSNQPIIGPIAFR